MRVHRPTPRDLAKRMTPQARRTTSEETARAVAEQFAPCPVDDLIKPREGLCAFDAAGMNEVEGRK